ncbi:aminoglycoside phosphotransferase family protein [Jannaschia ovalis]|uniref:Phosphotransferase n=1 Tax=Jannaschia ovalis TaxID=3038773 RepID=A0ABY8LBC5_9RHOB|nr:phosphotransferase [Jannaschia sp. GRR-S6-38]WGH77459.1 phosphotransferase [Jannaschia sp. GRR-S6-38]
MSARDRQIDAFLADAGWGAARRVPLAGDASLRRYIRLHGPAGTAMLMDAPPGSGEDVRPFRDLATHLAGQGLSVPRIRAADVPAGLLLLEDLGDALFARHAAAHPGAEPELYAAAGALLGHLHAMPRPAGLPDYRPLMPDLAGLALDWYAPEARAQRPALVAAMAAALDAVAGPPVFVHRDYHAENLIWLPERAGAARVGLLDFQDAMAGPAAYDLASLIHDPRRAVSPAARRAATEAFRDATGIAADRLDAQIAVTSAQRALRILGVFARLCLRDGKTRYPEFIPATWQVLQDDLRHPVLAPLREICAALPAPDAARLDAIRARAGRLAGRSDAA